MAQIRWGSVALFFLVFQPGSARAQIEADSLVDALAEARAALLVRDQIDEYLELRRSVLQPAIGLSSTTHRRDAEWALESLDLFEEQFREAVEGLQISVDDEIDLVLLAHHAADLRARLVESLADELLLRELLPAAGLRERLPVLTGLVDSHAASRAIGALEETRRLIPAPWVPLPEEGRLTLVRAAESRARGLDRFLTTWVERAKNRFDDSVNTRIAEAAEAVSEGLESFAARLGDEVIPELENTDAAWGSPIGRERFVTILRNRHMIYETPEELLEFGRRQLDSLTGEIVRVARRIDRRATPDEVWERLKQNHPTRTDLPQFAYDEMVRALDLLAETGAITIPANARQNVMQLTEGRTWDTYPFGGYGGFSLQGRNWVGRFLTSPPPVDVDSSVAETRLRGNNYYWARVVAVHEVYPGHHLQSVTSRISARSMRRNYYTTTLGEGWGLYSEQLMYRLGFFEDDGTEMAMLMMRVWRAARVIIDVSLHLELMSFDEAVQFLVDNVDMDEDNARSEVRRYIGNPTRPLSYLYGYDQIEKLRNDFMALRGDAFDQREFHDTLLSYGSIPVPLIRAGMLGEEIPQTRP